MCPVFQVKSPSSGLFRVKVYNDKGMATKTGAGMFPRALMQRLPLLPIPSGEEGRHLRRLPLRENFIERVVATYGAKFMEGLALT